MFPSVASADEKSITAIATGNLHVNAAAQKDAAIKAALDKAREAAGPAAITLATAEERRLTAASGLTRGALTSVAEQLPSPFYGGPYSFGIDGAFGAGKCYGTIRTPIYKIKNGRRTPAGKFRAHHGCRYPRQVATTASVTFAAT